MTEQQTEQMLAGIAAWRAEKKIPIVRPRLKALQSRHANAGARVLAAVAETFEVRTAEILSRSQEAHVALPRHVACALLRQVTDWGLARIGLTLNRHHSTVLASVRVLEARLAADPQLDARYRRLLEQLRAPEEIAA